MKGHFAPQRPAAGSGDGPYTAWGKNFAAATAAAAAVANFFLSGIRAIFLNFVAFSTKHGSTSDKACVRLVGSRYVHANAHRRP